MINSTHIEWKELIEKDPNAVIIDCRTASEWNQGVIEGSLLIDLLNPQRFMFEAEKLNKEKNYYIYCRSGIRSVTACQILESSGVKNTYNLLGGLMNWQDKLVPPMKLRKAN